MENDTPEYRQMRERENLVRIHRVVEDNIRYNTWYCPSCGVPYDQKLGFRSRCDECGDELEVE